MDDATCCPLTIRERREAADIREREADHQAVLDDENVQHHVPARAAAWRAPRRRRPGLGRLAVVILLLLPDRPLAGRSGQAVLSVVPTTIAVQVMVGQNPPPQTVRIDNAGNRALKWAIIRPAEAWVAVTPTSGTQGGTLTLTFSTALLATGLYQSAITVVTATASVRIPIQVSIIDAPATLVVTCPAAMSVPSPAGIPVVVTYAASTTPLTMAAVIAYVPVSGSLFAIGATTVTATASSVIGGQVSTCVFVVTVVLTPPPTTTRGPQPTISCPTGAVPIGLTTSIQGAVNANPGATVFCLAAGVHPVTSAVTPKSGNTFVGEYGAILDGSGWTTTDTTQGAFRAHNEDIDDVTIRNLVIRRMPQRGIHAYKDFSTHWVIDHTEIADCKYGVLLPHNHVVTSTVIHDNVGNPTAAAPEDRGGGYAAYQAVGGLWEDNEIAHNGPEQKIAGGTNVIFRRNVVHHNGDGIWFDGDNVGSVIEDNLIEDNAGAGIFYEVSGRGVIRNNTIRRSGGHGIFISTSQDVDVYGNTLEENFRGIQYFVNCAAVGVTWVITYDLRTVASHDNTITVGAQPDAFASLLSSVNCTPTQFAVYTSGAKALSFTGNSYVVPSATGRYWLWDGLRDWPAWQALGHDTAGSVRLTPASSVTTTGTRPQ